MFLLLKYTLLYTVVLMMVAQKRSRKKNFL